MGENTNGFYEYLPQGYDNSNALYPLMIFIHGLGDRGNGGHVELKRVLNNGIPKLIHEGSFPASFTVNNQNFKFIVLSPQFMEWPEPSHIENIINYAIKNYRVDQSRIYLTGLSMGGGAVWDYSGNNSYYANRIAAIVPVCGGSWPEPSRAYVIGDADLPVWATHNNGDQTVPVHYTNDYISRINSRSPNPAAKKTIFISDSHDAWTQTYDPGFNENGLNVYQWMLQYQRSFAVLPVRLKEYKVFKSSSSKATVSWTTSEEINNHYFTIERSSNGISFTEIVKQNARNSPGEYSFTDEHPEHGINYYRLSQTDINGQVKYFEIHKLKFDSQATPYFTLAPNPVSGPLQVKLENEDKGNVSIRVINSSGTLMKQWSIKKENYQVTYQIETSDLSPGLYFVEARGKAFGQINSFIKN